MISPHALTGPVPGWQPPLDFEEPNKPTFSQLGASGSSDGIATEWRPAGNYAALSVGEASTEDAALRRAARFAQPVERYVEQHRTGWSMVEAVTSPFRGGAGGAVHRTTVDATGTAATRLPMLVVESPRPNTKPYLVVPTEGLRGGEVVQNVGMPPVGEQLVGGHVVPERYGSFSSGYPLLEGPRGRVVAMTDGVRIARFPHGATTGTVELLADTIPRGGRGRAAALIGAATLGVTRLAGRTAAP